MKKKMLLILVLLALGLVACGEIEDSPLPNYVFQRITVTPEIENAIFALCSSAATDLGVTDGADKCPPIIIGYVTDHGMWPGASYADDPTVSQGFLVADEIMDAWELTDEHSRNVVLYRLCEARWDLQNAGEIPFPQGQVFSFTCKQP